VVAFDKTGTLTHGSPKLVAAVPLAPGVSADELLRVAASAEALSGHPIAKAVVAGAKERGLSLGHGEDLVAVHGKGLRATVDGVAVEVGSLDLFGERATAEDKAAIDEQQALGRTTLLVAKDNVTLGVLAVSDTLRTEAAPTLRSLAEQGVERTVMLSGDNTRVAEAVAKLVGITDARAPMMPADKVRAVRELSRRGGVVMVGDGVNDAPALAAANVGVAMGAGSDLALQTADVVLMGDDLSKLAFARSLARAADSVVKQNLALALGVAALLCGAAALGRVEISGAVILHEGSTLLVVLNGLRLLGYRHK
jgi:Cd2+/Zn2+-exporting ATPase